MIPETEARLLHLVGALLYHHSEFTKIPVSELIDKIVMPTMELESIAKQVDMTQLILRGERTALEVTTMLKSREHLTLLPRLSGSKDWRLD